MRTIGVAAHRGELRSLVLGLKLARERANAAVLASLVSDVLPRFLIDGSIVTWAPTTDRHRHERGMDHAEEIARHVAADLRLSVRGLLRRTDARNQTGLGRVDRQTGPRFVGRPLRGGPPVVVVDDVVTTGATLAAAARALVAAGASDVVCIAPSRTM